MTTDMFDMTGRNVLITGATGHLGRAMVQCLASAGAHVYANARSLARYESSVAALDLPAHATSPAIFDVTNDDEVSAFFDTLRGPLHSLVNNAYAGGAGDIQHSTAQQYLDSFDVTVAAAHRMLTHGLPALKLAVTESADASVINVGSMYGIVTPTPELYDSGAVANPPYYGAAKAALDHWSRYAAREMAPFGIRVNSIAPGPFPSSETQQSQTAFVQRLAKRAPLGRIGQPEDLRGPLLLLTSPASSYMTGATLVVDGGWVSS